MMKGGSIFGLATGSVVLLATVASVGPWTPPTVVAGPGAWGERVAVDGQGRATIVWATRAGTEQGSVQAVSRSPGGHWSAPQDVSSPGVWAYGAPDLGVDAAGDATVVWASGSYPSVTVQTAHRPVGGMFGRAEALAPPVENVFSVRVAVDARGDAVAVWTATSGSLYVLKSSYRPAGGAFGAPEDVAVFSPDPQVPSFDLAIDPNGAVVIVWAVFPTPRSLVQAAFRPAGGTFGLPVTLAEATSPAFVGNSEVVIDADGTATAVWTNSLTVQTSTRSAAAGTWNSPVDVAEGANPTIAVDARGEALAAWAVNRPGTNGMIQVSSRTKGGTWLPAVTVSPPTDSAHADPALAVDAAGDAVLAWSLSAAEGQLVAASTRRAGGQFGPARDVSQAGVVSGGPQVALDPSGNATLVWAIMRSPTPRFSFLGYVAAATSGGTMSALR